MKWSMQGSKKPPTSEVIESSPSKSDSRTERHTSPPSAMRRDDRAEPDDDAGVSSSRIDVVNVDSGRGDGRGGDNAASGMIALRRELAKLHQQAAAVEKSLEDQRRDRSDSLDRLERATERVLLLEGRLAAAEAEADSLRNMREASLAELRTVRAERDDLALAVEAAKNATADVGKLRDEVNQLRAAAAEAASTGGELAKARAEIETAKRDAEKARADAEKAKRALDVAEGDAAMVGEQASKIRAEAAEVRASFERTREELAKAQADLAKARAEFTQSREDSDELTTMRQELASVREELATARQELATTREELAKSGDELTESRDELTKSHDELTKSRDELTTVRQELARAKEDNTRDRATARDRIDLLERALDDAREANTRTEELLEAARESEDRASRQVAAANARAAAAETNALSLANAHATLENNVRRLREEIAAAFARAVNEAPARATMSSPASTPEDASAKSSPASKSVPPPPPNPSVAPPHASVPPPHASVPPPHASVPPPRASLSPPTYASVPPQVHESAAPARAPSIAPERTSVGPGGPVTAPPPAELTSVPAAARGSIPPPTRHSPSSPSDVPPADDGWANNDSSPPTRRPGSAVPPPYHETADLTSKARQELLAKLVDPDHAEAAAAELRTHPEWLRSVPPPALVAALSNVDYDAEGALFDLARAWDREPLCHSLIAALRSETDMRVREHSAWLLKHLAAPSSWKAIADLARSDDEPVQMRRWLLEALDRLAAGRAIGWRELGDVVTAVARHPDASLRDGVVGILVSLDRSDEKRRLLLDILRADDDEVVLASAVNALASVLPMELDPGLVDRLLGHPSPRVQRSVRDLIERARVAKG